MYFQFKYTKNRYKIDLYQIQYVSCALNGKVLLSTQIGFLHIVGQILTKPLNSFKSQHQQVNSRKITKITHSFSDSNSPAKVHKASVNDFKQ